MPKLKNKQYSYILLLAVSFFLVAGAWKLGLVPVKEASPQLPREDMPASTLPNKAKTDNAQADAAVPPTEPGTGEVSTTVSANMAQTADTEKKPALSPVPDADRSYFDDALFIGDSRTVGLYEYGDLSQAVVLADSGMNIYKVFNRTFTMTNGETRTLEEILTEKQFGKIYLMLGINELGYDFEQTAALYEDVVEQLEAFQPEAVLFLQANLHITREKSMKSDIFNNENINRFNAEIERLAEESHDDNRIFLDVNQLFDDETGSLSTAYTADAAHVLGKYYADWVDWLLQHAAAYSE